MMTSLPSARLQAANNDEWAQMTVKIVDPEGMPIVGAKVRPWGTACW